MNKIVYFTNALDQNSFNDYLKDWKISPNLSNQNFHHKLIKALSLYFDVDVISVRAINSNFAKTKLDASEYKENNIHWLYPKVSANKAAKALLLGNRIKKVLSKHTDESFILVDSLNYSLVKEAYKYAHRNGLKIIGVCTDNPYNISFISNLYIKNLMKYATKLDGYIVLTEGMNKVFNQTNKPYLLIDGVSEDVVENIKPLRNDKYIYFGGSLMEEYGIYSLIDAFKELKLEDIKLIICGHHVQKDKLNSKIIDNNIVYLGPVNYLDNLSLERNALLSVNPRPINPKIDDYSIPSKTLECLSMKCLNVTVNNRLLKKNYEECIIWADSSSVDDLKEAISRALALSDKEKNQIIEIGYKKVMSRTSQKVIGKEIEIFLSKFFLN